MNQPRSQQREPVDVTFAVRDAFGYLKGSEVSNHLRLLNMVEFSYYLGFPVLQIAERESITILSNGLGFYAEHTYWDVPLGEIHVF